MKNIYLVFTFVTLLFACTQNPKKTKTFKSNISNGSKELLKEYTKLGKLHTKLEQPQPGEWLSHHKEKGQAFGNYIKSKRVCPNDSLNKIAILPLGNFSELEIQLLKQVAHYVSTFFMMDVKLLTAISDKVVPLESRRINYNLEQLHTKFILDSILSPNIPDSAICFISITNKDLYPRDDWNFVFGQAYLRKRTGVSSFRRYFENKLDSTNYRTCLQRTIKTTTHELSHMFSIKHCRIYKCLLNGSNHMQEADSKPLWLCPECLAKLQNCLKFDLFERYDHLIEFFNKYQMSAEVKYYQKSKQLIGQETN